MPQPLSDQLRALPLAFRSFWLTTLVSEGVIASPYRTHVRPRRSLGSFEPLARVGGLIRFVPSQLRDWAFAKDRTRG